MQCQKHLPFYIVTLLVVCLAPIAVQADVPRYISYQGRLGGVVDGSDPNMIVTFWNDLNSTDYVNHRLFYDKHDNVTVINGVFSIELGDGVDSGDPPSPNNGIPDDALVSSTTERVA